MSWSTDRLSALSARWSYRTISRETGIPISSISYVIRGQRDLPKQYVQSLRNYYARDVYAQLRSAGLNPNLARKYRWYSPTHQQEFLGEATYVVEEMAKYRLDKYRDYLIKQGRYTTDEDAMRILRDSIRTSIGKSPIDAGKHEGQDSPTIRTVIGPVDR